MANSIEQNGQETLRSTPTELVSQPSLPIENQPLVGQTIGSYLVLQELGYGGMAIVYKARHLILDRLVALKEIQSNLCQQPRFLKRFQIEARTAARILHPNVVTVYEHMSLPGRHFLVLEYVPGGTLYQRWKDRPMPLEEAQRALMQILTGLQAIHAEKIVHRDLKPQNVLIDAYDNLKIGDFGLAHLLGDNLSTVMGTVQYMAPEACNSGEQDVTIDQRIDIYALGIMTYELLLGEQQFLAVMAAQPCWNNSLGGWLLWHCSVEARLPRVDTIRPEVPAPLAIIIERMMEKDLTRRYCDVAAILRDLTNALATKPTELSPAAEQIELSQISKIIPRRATFAVLALTLLTLLAIIIAIYNEGELPLSQSPPTAPPKFHPPTNMLLVPAGPFRMGSDSGSPDLYPEHEVYVRAFYIDRTEVTNHQYRAFCDATGRSYPENPPWDTNYFLANPDHPVIGIGWEEARAYAAWIGKRLPSEAEWEKAARGQQSYLWPWGNTPAMNLANLDGDEDSFIYTAPAGSFLVGVSPYGALDMIGNVWEWVEDNYQPYPGNKQSNQFYGKNYRVLRGGGYVNGPAKSVLNAAFRGFATPVVNNELRFAIGFRCATDIPKE
ncbi:MAG: bifunctional serine/threonine-protein kinase/formylglycine-generating enzyme family protein [Acidobacteriota bacterium]